MSPYQLHLDLLHVVVIPWQQPNDHIVQLYVAEYLHSMDVHVYKLYIHVINNY